MIAFTSISTFGKCNIYYEDLFAESALLCKWRSLKCENIHLMFLNSLVKK